MMLQTPFNQHPENFCSDWISHIEFVSLHSIERLSRCSLAFCGPFLSCLSLLQRLGNGLCIFQPSNHLYGFWNSEYLPMSLYEKSWSPGWEFDYSVEIWSKESLSMCIQHATLSIDSIFHEWERIAHKSIDIFCDCKWISVQKTILKNPTLIGRIFYVECTWTGMKCSEIKFHQDRTSLRVSFLKYKLIA